VVRTTIVAVGLGATALITLAAIPLFILSSYDHKEVLGTLLTAGAIAGPLFGTIAATQQNRWNPLVTGSALGCLALIVLFALLG